MANVRGLEEFVVGILVVVVVIWVFGWLGGVVRGFLLGDLLDCAGWIAKDVDFVDGCWRLV